MHWFTLAPWHRTAPLEHGGLVSSGTSASPVVTSRPIATSNIASLLSRVDPPERPPPASTGVELAPPAPPCAPAAASSCTSLPRIALHPIPARLTATRIASLGIITSSPALGARTVRY